MIKLNILKRWSGKALLTATMLLGTPLAASAAAPIITGYNIASEKILFPAQCDSLKVYYDRDKVLSATYELRQNGKVVFTGSDDGKGTGLNHSIFNINVKNPVNNAMLGADKKLEPGEVEFAVTSVTYMEGDGEETAKDLGSVKWKLTDMPLISQATPMWHPDKELPQLKTGTASLTFSCDNKNPNFGSYIDEDQGKTVVYVRNQIKSGEISLIQGGEVKHVMTATNTLGYFGYPTNVKPGVIDDDLAKLAPGEVEIRLTKITYISPCTGEDVTVSDPEGLPTTWKKDSFMLIPERAKTFAKIIATTKIESETLTPYEDELLSYYPTDGEAGVFSYTFTEPLAPGKSGNGDFVVKFRIGDANHDFDNVVPHTLSADKKTITVDLRGLSNGIPTLANNYDFQDDDGNSYIPEYCQIFIESGLFDANGAKVVVFCQFDPNGSGRDMEGQLWRGYRYNEISFPTPALSDALFYSKADAENKSGVMAAGSDMMDVTVSNSVVITKAEPVFLIGEDEVPTTATHDGDTWSVAIPETVIANGVDNLQFTLKNVEYNKVDGNEHIVSPLSLSELAPVKEFETLADVVKLEPQTEVVINTKGILVTMSNGMITTVEDSTDALLVIDKETGSPAELPQGYLLTGKISGVYVGGNMFILDKEKSEYTESEADIATGYEVTADADLNQLGFRLLTFSAEEGCEFTPIGEEGEILRIKTGGSLLPVMDVTGAFEDFECPEKIVSVTGVLYTMESFVMLIVRDAADIKFAQELPTVESIRELKASEIGQTVALKLTDAVVTAVFDDPEDTELVLLQDEGCAINLVTEDEEGVTFKRGASVSGTLVGMYVGDHTFVVDFAASDFTEDTADVTKGHEIALGDLFDINNQFRLVTFTNSDETPILWDEDYDAAIVGEQYIYVTNHHGVFDNITKPEDKKIHSLTGVLFFPDMAMYADEDDNTPSMVMLIPRDANDIVKLINVGVEGIFCNLDKDTPVYDLNGAKVREAGEGIKGLDKGIYIVNGKKVIVF